jgi:hypothetical protein
MTTTTDDVRIQLSGIVGFNPRFTITRINPGGASGTMGEDMTVTSVAYQLRDYAENGQITEAARDRAIYALTFTDIYWIVLEMADGSKRQIARTRSNA